MMPITIGLDARGDPLTLDPAVRQQTHMHIVGASGTGKSKFLEWLIRQDLDEGHGLCVLDWHGTLYHDVLRYCAFQDVGVFGDPRHLILLNPSQPDYITGFNPFASAGPDVSVQVTRRINATIRPWGVTDTTETPTFARVCRVLYTFMVETGETLPNAATMLHFKNRRLRDYAAGIVEDTEARNEWEEIQHLTRFKDWKEEVLSTKNRLVPFVNSKSVRRFMGLREGNLDLADVMDKGNVLLVNLADSDFLDRDTARVFASLLLLQFFETAMRRATRASMAGEKPRPFILYLDEFQEYITDDIAAMLDQVRKGGLHMVLTHQHLGHFIENPRLKKSVFTNARIKAVFGGLDYEDAAEIAREMFLSDLNERQIKKAYYHTIHLYGEETRTVRNAAAGSRCTTGRSRTARSKSSSIRRPTGISTSAMPAT
jgi:Type IV secretion-system coupling protein DNA-binding domain